MKKIFSVAFFIATFFASFSVAAQDQLVAKNMPLPNLHKKFTIVAHITQDTTGAIGIDTTLLKAMVANEVGLYFAPIGVSFEVCKIDIIPNYAFDKIDVKKEDMEMLKIHHVANRINVFILSATGVAPPMCGFAKLGGIANLLGDGVFLQKNCLSAITFAHELGHYFGLEHTFEIAHGKELVNGSNSATAGDGIIDTPADPLDLKKQSDLTKYVSTTKDCRFINKWKDANGDYYVPDVGNIMSYYPCQCSFTVGQLQKMADTYLAAPEKMW